MVEITVVVDCCSSVNIASIAVEDGANASMSKGVEDVLLFVLDEIANEIGAIVIVGDAADMVFVILKAALLLYGVTEADEARQHKEFHRN